MAAEEFDENGVLIEQENRDVVVPEQVSALTLVRGEVEMQLDAAHKYPRSVRKFLNEAKTLATMDEETARSCIYALPRGGKTISGPSVRCAEICISAWGNSHVGARIVGIDGNNIVAQGMAWDLEKNVKYQAETRRRITDRQGRTFNDDMVTVTGNAAASIALRNAIFKIIPRAYVQQVYDAARMVAVGSAKTLADRRPKVMERLAQMGATQERVLAALGRASVEDVTVDDLETLVGLGTALKNGERKVDDVFPEPKPPVTDVPKEAEGKRMSLKKEKAPAMPAPPEASAGPQQSLPVTPPRDPGQGG
jgi:hypothetical protein